MPEFPGFGGRKAHPDYGEHHLFTSLRGGFAIFAPGWARLAALWDSDVSLFLPLLVILFLLMGARAGGSFCQLIHLWITTLWVVFRTDLQYWLAIFVASAIIRAVGVWLLLYHLSVANWLLRSVVLVLLVF